MAALSRYSVTRTYRAAAEREENAHPADQAGRAVSENEVQADADRRRHSEGAAQKHQKDAAEAAEVPSVGR